MSSDAIIIDLNPEVTYPPTRSTRAEVLDAIRDIVHRRTGLDLSGEFIVNADDDEDVTITLCGARLSEGGDIIAPPKRQYQYSGTVTIEVAVGGFVEAANEEEAEELAEAILASIEVDSTPEVSSYEDDGLQVDDYSVSAYGEVSQVYEA